MPNTSQRLAGVGVIVICLFLALAGRLGQLQVVETDRFARESEVNRTRIGFGPVVRGRILDRNGNVLVGNRKVNVVRINTSELPRRASQRRAVFAKVGQVLGIPPAVIEDRVKRRGGQLEAVEIAREVRQTTIVYLNEQAAEFPGVITDVDTQRIYPQGTLAAHVVGYVGDIGDDIADPTCPTARYQTGDRIGKAGVELEYECELRGLPGIYEYTVNRAGRVVGEPRELRPPVPGRDIRLTIDPEIQAVLESSISTALRLSRREVGEDRSDRFPDGTPRQKLLKAPAGAGVVIDNDNGEIIAMVSYPTYDPNDFVRGIGEQEFQRKYGDQQLAPLTNRAITTRYSPASTFKVFTAIAGLTSGYISPTVTYMDNGVYTLPDCLKNPELSKQGVKCKFRNAGSTPHGPVDTTLSMIVSSDVYYYDLAQRIWTGIPELRESIQDVARDFGMGDRTTVRLPYEKSSPVPSPDVKRQRHALNPEVWPDADYRTGDNLNLAIGQGEMAVTVLNLAAAYGAFANGGTLYVPQVAFRTPPPPDGGVTDLEALRAEAAANRAEAAPASSTSVAAGASSATSVSPTSVVPGSVVPGSVVPGSVVSGSVVSGSVVSGQLVSGSVVPTSSVPGSSPASTTASPAGSGPGPTSAAAPGSTGPTAADGSTSVPPALPTVPTVPVPAPLPTVAAATTTTLVPPAQLDAVVRRRIDLPPEVRDPILEGLRGVTTSRYGTASDAFAGFPATWGVAGKTGTAQTNRQDNALFVGFGPTSSPKYTVAVVLEQAGFGGQAAAPVARRVFNVLAGLPPGQLDLVRSAGAIDR